MGKAYIIGTGPGDEELLTLKAVRALKECTAVLYDKLISSNVLNYLNDDCEIYYCGKEPGCHYKSQEEINTMIVELAKKGHIVGRVKGGDPYVFGRGGEEVLELGEHNIDFEVIPGVTSPIAVLNYAGIPITQRDISQSFHVITGMTAGAEKINWNAIANEKGTLVFMMGLNNLENIIRNLLENGKDSKTPAAIVMKGCTAKQKKVIGTLENISKLAQESNLTSPCIIVVGDVVKLANKLSWYEEKPLFGKNICVTRSRSQSSNLKTKLKSLGAEVTEINSLKIVETKENLNPYLEKLNSYNHIIFTSVNAVNTFFDYLVEQKHDVRNLKAMFHCVGKATDKALMQRGIVSFTVAKEFTAENLFEKIKEDLAKNDKVLIPCSNISNPVLYDRINELGVSVDRVHIYSTVAGNVRNKNAFKEVDVILYTSPSTVNNMISMLGIDQIKNKKSIAIGPRTAKELKNNNIDCIMCKKHSEEGFLEEIIDMKNDMKIQITERID